MPKQRITKEMVIDAAFELAREGGMEEVQVKRIAERLNCSVQPIYSYCKNMEGLKREVTARVRAFIGEYVSGRLDEKDLFHSTGRAYIRIAGEEPQLFRIFVLHEREHISSFKDLYRSETNPHMAESIAGQLHIPLEQAVELHLNMLIYTIGLGAVFSVTKPGIPVEEILARQEIAYEAFWAQASKQGRETRDE